jgi:hypothetical protein
VSTLDPDDVRSAALSPDARQELHAKREKYALSVLVMFSAFRHPDLSNAHHAVPAADAAAPALAAAVVPASAASAAAAEPAGALAVQAPPAATSYWTLYRARIATIRQCPIARRVLDHIQDFYDDAHDHTDSHPIEPSALELQLVRSSATHFATAHCHCTRSSVHLDCAGAGGRARLRR